MTRNEMIDRLTLWVKEINQQSYVPHTSPVNVDDFDIWVNNSDGEGEDVLVLAIGDDTDGNFGLYMVDGDFFPFSDLSDEEVEYVYECIMDDTLTDLTNLNHSED